MDAITFDQFTVFLTVVEEGSFAAAARKLGRVQSAITYATQKLEEQCGMELFDRTAYRPTLTAQGRALLPRIQRVLDNVAEFRVQAQSMAQGVEPELVLAIDGFLPLSLITPALKQFHAEFPMVQLRINAVWSLDAPQQLVDKDADLGVFLRMPGLPSELENKVVDEIDLVAVAAPGHPLSKLPPGFSSETMRDHLQIVVSNPKMVRDAQAFGVVGVNQWRVSEVRLRHDLIKAGIGWGSMPSPMVKAEIARGELVALAPAQWDSSDKMPRLTIIIARRKDKAMGPAATFLMSAISRGSLKSLLS